MDAGGMVTQNIYNSLMQVATVRRGKKGEKKDGLYEIAGEVRETSYAYDGLGRTTGVTDAMEGSATVTFDSLGRITSMRDSNQNNAAEQLKREGKTPAPQGRKAEEGQAAVPEMSYTYNGNGLLETETNALGNTVSYRYNAQMLLSELTDSAGEKTEYAYDGFGRIREVKDGLGTITYDYDANSNVTYVTETLADGNKKTIHREFDCLNRVTKYVDYKGREVKYGYDELGNLATLAYPGGEIVRYTYQGDGLAETMVSQSGGTYTFGYDRYGRLETITRPDGTVETRGYTPAGRLQSQTEKKGEETLRTTTYTYNVFGEVTEKTAEDADHNLLEAVTMEYDDANRLKTYNGQAVTYDAKGNMTYGPVDGVMQALTYDCRNRLTEAGGVSYAYDAENTRISSTKDGRVTEYVTDTAASPSRLLTAYEADGTETRYYYGAEGLSAQYSSGTGEALYYHFDNIGSTLFVTGSDGTILERYTYGTYGELLCGSEKRIRFLFNGSYGVATDENGLYYMRARYYNSDIKRFINQDIKTGGIGDSQSLNRYAYCEGNPVSLVDPFGLSPENANGTGNKWTIHDTLNVVGLFWDGADLINAALYAKEGNWVEAAKSAACALPFVGNVVAGVTKATRLAKAGETVCTILKTASKLQNTVSSATQALELAGDARLEYAKEGRITANVAARAAGAVVMAGLSAASAKSLTKEVLNMSKAKEIAFDTSGRSGASMESGQTTCRSGVGCFLAGTMVKTADGDTPIEEVAEGSYVLAEDPETGEQGYRKVTRTYIHESDFLVHVYVGEERIDTTPEHPFYVEGTGFVTAGNLKAGDIIRTSDGRRLPILKAELEELDEPVPVYNFEVEEFHTYYVSVTGVLVHNKCEVVTCAGAGKGGRNSFGVVSGGENLSNARRMMHGSQGNVGVIPKEIADKMRGRQYSNFDAFREDFWKTVADSSYASEFSNSNIGRMRNGRAPKVVLDQTYGQLESYILHHKTPIHAGGEVYNLDNLAIVTPRMHQEILDKAYHFGN